MHVPGKSGVLLQQRDHISDSPGIAFGVELVSVLDKPGQPQPCSRCSKQQGNQHLGA